jgi:hypothetical protein
MDPSFLPLFLYAETHFRLFGFFPSLLFRRWPEVIFDAPRRLDPGQDLPVLLLINDIHKFPVEIVEIELALSCRSQPPKLIKFADIARHEIEHPLSRQCRAFIFPISRPEIRDGLVFVNGKATIRIGRRAISVLNTNLATATQAPLLCLVSDIKLPGSEFCSYGDLHVHSHYSRSHIEFGPPIIAIARILKAAGMDFAAITDHSYDLACLMDDYLREDPSVARWKAFQEELRNTADGVMLAPGEEISCVNAKGRVVHLLGIGMRDFIPGSADGARFGRHFKTIPSVREATDEIHRQNALAFAAHPGNRFGLVQQLIFHRGHWGRDDLDQPLDGMQAINSGFGPSWYNAKRLWISKLQRGHKCPLIAGNDAHGDFNRYLAIKAPFITIYENPDRYLCATRTGVYGKVRNPADLYFALRQGKTFVTNGPYLSICDGVEGWKPLVGNTEIDLKSHDLSIESISSYDFGAIRSVRLIGWKNGDDGEHIIISRKMADNAFEFKEKIALPQEMIGSGYLRAEVTCVREDGSTSEAFTSPCYWKG